MRVPAFVIGLALVVAGCATARRPDWPSLAARPGERASVAGSCGGCGLAAPEPPVPVRELAPPRALPADAAATLAEVERDLKAIEARLPKQAAAARRAQAAARGRGEADDVTVAAEVQRTRLEALTLPLPDLQERLDTLAAAVEGVEGGEPVKARIAGLTARIAAAEAVSKL